MRTMSDAHIDIGLTARTLRASTENVSHARAFARRALDEIAQTDPSHVDDVILVLSELVTNAVTHTDTRSVSVELEISRGWTGVIVRDQDPRVHGSIRGLRVRELPAALLWWACRLASALIGRDDLRVSRRGLKIVKQVTVRFWWKRTPLGKRAHAVILRTGVTLTRADRRALREAMAR
jgi:hypothetical protein